MGEGLQPGECRARAGCIGAGEDGGGALMRHQILFMAQGTKLTVNLPEIWMMNYSADGKGLYQAGMPKLGFSAIYYMDLRGQSQVVWQEKGTFGSGCDEGSQRTSGQRSASRRSLTSSSRRIAH
jgi:hypothetical protein